MAAHIRPQPGQSCQHLQPSQNDEEFYGSSMAVDEINADPAKRVLGRKLKVIHADAGSTPDEAQGQTARLLTVDKSNT